MPGPHNEPLHRESWLDRWLGSADHLVMAAPMGGGKVPFLVSYRGALTPIAR